MDLLIRGFSDDDDDDGFMDWYGVIVLYAAQ